jgi:hypothetical protein
MLTPHQLKTPIEWKQIQHLLPNVELKSYRVLSKIELAYLKHEVIKVEEGFRVYNNPDACSDDGFELRVVSHQQMNNSRYFNDLEPEFVVYGRYYRLSNIMYVTPDTFNETEFIRHEVTHYMYDVCGLTLDKNDNHDQINSFLKWLK